MAKIIKKTTQYSQMIPVESTQFSEYFDDVQPDSIFLLGDEEARTFWKEKIDPKASSYFKFPDANWLVSGKTDVVGEWVKSYNEDRNEPVAKVLKNSVKWFGDIDVRFFVSQYTIFETKWKYFLRDWDDFLGVDDECPFVCLKFMEKREAILFASLGEIRKITFLN